eukprot:11968803-Alexandrium_andersonii.AAC.1
MPRHRGAPHLPAHRAPSLQRALAAAGSALLLLLLARARRMSFAALASGARPCSSHVLAGLLARAGASVASHPSPLA